MAKGTIAHVAPVKWKQTPSMLSKYSRQVRVAHVAKGRAQGWRFRGYRFNIHVGAIGYDGLIKRMVMTHKESIKAIEREVIKMAKEVYKRAKELTPVDTGYLKNSAYIVYGGPANKDVVHKPRSNKKIRDIQDRTDPVFGPYRRHGQRLKASRRYVRNQIKQGIPAVGVDFYASHFLLVHELPANHDVGQWKFLETAVAEMRGQMGARLSQAVNKGRKKMPKAKRTIRKSEPAVSASEIIAESTMKRALATVEADTILKIINKTAEPSEKEIYGAANRAKEMFLTRVMELQKAGKNVWENEKLVGKLISKSVGGIR